MKKLIWLLLLLPAFAQSQQKTKERKGEFYFSWGYNKEWYTHSDLKVNQPALNNNYVLNSVQAHDHIGWDQGIFSIPISIPQYNYRLGYFFNKKKGLAFEINFDHTKYIITDGQQVRLTGTLNGRQVDTAINFASSQGFYYFLNNGANFLLFNIVKRWNWFETNAKKFKVDALAKAGIGPVIPHVQNSLFGNENQQGFQFGGWNMGIEGGVRATLYKHTFLEFTNKIDYARYSNLKLYQGTAKQAFGTYEMILSIGYTIQAGGRVQQ